MTAIKKDLITDRERASIRTHSPSCSSDAPAEMDLVLPELRLKRSSTQNLHLFDRAFAAANAAARRQPAGEMHAGL